MAIGKKIKAEVQRQTVTSDGMGGETTFWYGLKIVKGSLDVISASERYKLDMVQELSTHRFTCDYIKDITITEKDRIYADKEIYDITAIDNVLHKNITLIIDLKKVI